MKSIKVQVFTVTSTRRKGFIYDGIAFVPGNDDFREQRFGAYIFMYEEQAFRNDLLTRKLTVFDGETEIPNSVALSFFKKAALNTASYFFRTKIDRIRNRLRSRIRRERNAHVQAS